MSIVLDGSNGITTPLDVEIQGSTSGSIVLAAPAVAGTNTQTLVAATGTLAPLIAATAVASTSGTSIDFTSIPSWVKRITVMFNGVSTNGTSNLLVQIGSGSFTTTGYLSSCGVTRNGSSGGYATSTAGFVNFTAAAAAAFDGALVLTNIAVNTWVGFGNLNDDLSFSTFNTITGRVALAGVLDRVRITTAAPSTDLFDAGTINIMYE